MLNFLRICKEFFKVTVPFYISQEMNAEYASAGLMLRVTPILGPPDVKSQLTEKDPDAGKDWRQEEKQVTEVEMLGWHHRLKGHESEQAPGESEGQGSLACCSPWGHKELDMTEQLNKSFIVSYLHQHRALTVLNFDHYNEFVPFDDVSSFGKSLFRFFCFLKDCFLMFLNYFSSLYILGTNSSSDIYILQTF